MYLIKTQFDKLNKSIEEMKQTFVDNIIMLSEIENKQLMILEGIKHDQDSISEKIDRIRETQLKDSSLLHKK
jgi:seryl-tRNA synthetase